GDTGRRGRGLDNPAALGDRGLQGSGDILHPHEERDQRRAALQRADATWHGTFDPGVDKGVAGNPAVGERPAEQLPEELAARVRVGGPDLEVNHWVTHLACSCRL